tara:strand:+ start:91 stop:438 length:348 start_codon:yes stop_codon:yes gene_type:complete
MAKKTVKQNKKEEKTLVVKTPKTREIKTRGRTFQGVVIKKLPGRVTIEFERMLRVPKYERYEKRKTKLHARNPSEIESEVEVGDLIQVGETRPISKTIHFIVTKIIRKKSEAGKK